jgi:hypothetical protein
MGYLMFAARTYMVQISFLKWNLNLAVPATFNGEGRDAMQMH